uniref:Uncharacterized protein n=1 Tax=Sinocyclocheilus anshuiensis TaxID=1608454 RepID=A0A671PUI4_9TELE
MPMKNLYFEAYQGNSCRDKPGLCFYRFQSQKENPQRRNFEHFIKGAKSDDPLSPYRVPSVLSHTSHKEEEDRKDRFDRMKNKRVEKKQDAVDDLLELPDAEQCREKIDRLQRECNVLREENQKLKDIIK